MHHRYRRGPSVPVRRRHSHRHSHWHRDTSPRISGRVLLLSTSPPATTSTTLPTPRWTNASTPTFAIIHVHTVVVLISLALPRAFTSRLLGSVAVSLVLCAVLRGGNTRRSSTRGHATDAGEHFCCSLVGHNPILRDRRPTWSCWNPLATLDHCFLHRIWSMCAVKLEIQA